MWSINCWRKVQSQLPQKTICWGSLIDPCLLTFYIVWDDYCITALHDCRPFFWHVHRPVRRFWEDLPCCFSLHRKSLWIRQLWRLQQLFCHDKPRRQVHQVLWCGCMHGEDIMRWGWRVEAVGGVGKRSLFKNCGEVWISINLYLCHNCCVPSYDHATLVRHEFRGNKPHQLLWPTLRGFW